MIRAISAGDNRARRSISFDGRGKIAEVEFYKAEHVCFERAGTLAEIIADATKTTVEELKQRFPNLDFKKLEKRFKALQRRQKRKKEGKEALEEFIRGKRSKDLSRTQRVIAWGLKTKLLKDLLSTEKSFLRFLKAKGLIDKENKFSLLPAKRMVITEGEGIFNNDLEARSVTIKGEVEFDGPATFNNVELNGFHDESASITARGEANVKDSTIGAVHADRLILNHSRVKRNVSAKEIQVWSGRSTTGAISTNSFETFSSADVTVKGNVRKLEGIRKGVGPKAELSGKVRIEGAFDLGSDGVMQISTDAKVSVGENVVTGRCDFDGGETNIGGNLYAKKVEVCPLAHVELDGEILPNYETREVQIIVPEDGENFTLKTKSSKWPEPPSFLEWLAHKASGMH